MKWSKYQELFFEFGVRGTGNGMVIAVAGSGKTASIEELCKRLPDDCAVKYLVFNKRNADEAQGRMPANVSASTFHAACMRPITREFGRVKVEQHKSQMILRDMDEEGLLEPDEYRRFAGPVERLVGLGKNSGIGITRPDTAEEWQDIIDHFGIEPPAPRGAQLTDEEADALNDQFIEMAQGVLWRSTQWTSVIDFDDMLYFVALYDLPMQTYDLVCVDEAQDTNALQRIVLREMINSHGRLIAVGDPRQAIYGFRGASADAMEIIRNEFNCTTLALSINYRCSTSVLDAAREYCPQLEARPDAPLGSLEWLPQFALAEFAAGDAVLSRVTAPLIGLAMRLIGNRQPATVLGRDIGAGLIALVRKVVVDARGGTVGHFEDALARYYARESARIQRHPLNAEVKQQRLDDQHDSLRAFIDSMEPEQPIEAMISDIEALFSDHARADAVTLATVHKAKGLEWPRVFVLDREDTMPHPMAKQPWQVEQEYNLIYVALTRARLDLRMINAVGIE